MSTTDFDCHKRYQVALSNFRTTLVYGPPGVGKTHGAVQSAIDRGEEYAKITCTDGDMAAEYRGMFIPQGDHFEYMLGVVTSAWCELNDGHGGLVVIDEIDHAPPEIHSFLHAMLDDPSIAKYTLPNKVQIKPGPKFRVVATMNGVPSDLTEALLDRFEARIHIDTPPPGALDLLPSDLQEKAVAFITNPDPEQRISFRQFNAFAKSRVYVGEAMAAQLCFGDRWNDTLTALRLAK